MDGVLRSGIPNSFLLCCQNTDSYIKLLNSNVYIYIYICVLNWFIIFTKQLLFPNSPLLFPNTPQDFHPITKAARSGPPSRMVGTEFPNARSVPRGRRAHTAPTTGLGRSDFGLPSAHLAWEWTRPTRLLADSADSGRAGETGAEKEPNCRGDFRHVSDADLRSSMWI